MGLLWGLIVHAANISERAGLKLLLASLLPQYLSRIQKILVDGGYSGKPLAEWVQKTFHWILEVSLRPQKHSFEVIPKRWIVERTFSWFEKYRRLSKDYEFSVDTSEAMIYLAMTRLMVRRLGRT